jgi:hypothetical protein
MGYLSNMAIKISGSQESFYPLYDNGRSLFYEDTEEMAARAAADPKNYATSFGYSGTYYDYVKEIAAECGGLGGLIKLAITKDEIANILKKSEFTGYRFDFALEWIIKTIELIQKMV